MQYVTKRAKSSENGTIFNQSGTIKEVFRKFRGKGCEYHSQYRSRKCSDRFPHDSEAYSRM